MKESLILDVLKIVKDAEAEGISFVKLLENIPSLNKEKSEDWSKLRIILSALIEDGLIEERHNLDGEDKKVDYAITQKGFDILKKLKL